MSRLSINGRLMTSVSKQRQPVITHLPYPFSVVTSTRVFNFYTIGISFLCAVRNGGIVYQNSINDGIIVSVPLISDVFEGEFRFYVGGVL